jgi:type III secretion protein L
MAFLIRGNQEIALPHADDKIIRSEDFWAYQHACEILEEGMHKHEQLVHAGEDAYRQAQERGYETGLEAARVEHSRFMMATIHQTVSYLNGIEMQLADVVLAGMRRLLSDFSDKQKVMAVVKTILAEVRNQKQIALKVNPEMVSQLQGELQRIQELYPMVSHIEVLAGAELGMDACIVETEIGIVQASITGQLRALHQSLSNVFGTDGNGTEERHAGHVEQQ